MNRRYFLKTERLGFSEWMENDLPLAVKLWGNEEVTRYICADGRFGQSDISARLAKEIENNRRFHVQHWPIFTLSSGELVGCCGLRPHGDNKYELGFHLLPEFWGQGYATEGAKRVIEYAFSVLKAESFFAGHNPNNKASAKVLHKLGFSYIGDEFYEPTGLYHPSYELKTPLSAPFDL